MDIKLGTNVRAGQQILVWGSWHKITEVNEHGAMTKNGLVKFGEAVGGWKAK